jgi:hypothetical protein
MKKIIFSTVLFTSLTLPVLANNQSDQVNVMIQNATSIDQNFRAITTDRIVATLVADLHSLINYANSFDDENLSEAQLEQNVELLVKKLEKSWKTYQDRDDEEKEIFLAEANFSEEFIQNLIDDYKSRTIKHV